MQFRYTSTSGLRSANLQSLVEVVVVTIAVFQCVRLAILPSVASCSEVEGLCLGIYSSLDISVEVRVHVDLSLASQVVGLFAQFLVHTTAVSILGTVLQSCCQGVVLLVDLSVELVSRALGEGVGVYRLSGRDLDLTEGVTLQPGCATSCSVRSVSGVCSVVFPALVRYAW